MNPADFRPAAFDSPEFRERLCAYLDGEMDPSTAQRFLALIEAHPEAWKAAEEARRVWALLAAYPEEAVPEGFAERVLARAGAHADLPAARGGLLQLGSRLRRAVQARSGSGRALAAAAALVVAVGAVALWSRGSSSKLEPEAGALASGSLDAVPDAFFESDHLASLALLSDEEFDAILSADPEVVAAEAAKHRGG